MRILNKYIISQFSLGSTFLTGKIHTGGCNFVKKNSKGVTGKNIDRYICQEKIFKRGHICQEKIL